jgi:4-amino-4-deoxy-L-arabinose transferase-like glycosyltransferase
MNIRARWILLFLCLFYAVHLVFIGTIQLAPDEAYYWYWSRHLDLSYVDHPPMVAYIMALFTWIGGNSAFFVRIGGLVCTVLANIFIFLTAKRIDPSDRQLPWEVLLVVNSTLLFSAGCIIQTPDTPLLLFWAMAAYSGAAIATGGGARWWYLFGIALGLGLLSKYTMILILPCQFGFILVSPDHRRWLLRKEPYLALLIGLVFFSPVIYWNWQHDWISFAFQWSHGFSADKRPLLGKLFEYMGGQLGVVTPLLFIAFVIYSIYGISLFRRTRHYPLLYLAFMSWPILFFFGLSTAKGDVAEANWPAPAYIAGLLLAWLVFRKAYRDRRAHRRWAEVAIALGLLLNLVLHIHLIHPIIPIAPDHDTTKQFHGWQELGQHLNALIDAHPSGKGYFLIANRGTTLAEAVFYTGNRFVGLHLFDRQKYTFLRNMDHLKGKDAMILVHHFSDDQLRRYARYFEALSVIGKDRYRYRGELIKKLSTTILLGQHFRGVDP